MNKKQYKNSTIRQSMVMSALVAMLAIGVFSVAMAPSFAETAKRGSYVYAKMIATSSSIEGIDSEDRVYFAWESKKPLRINVADPVTGQVILAEGSNVVVTNNDSKVTIRATIIESGIGGLNVGEVVTYTVDTVAKTATFVDDTSGQSVSGESVYANVGTNGNGR